MRRLAPGLVLVILAAVVAGCGGGGTTTVIEKTITEQVETPAKEGGAGAGDEGGSEGGGTAEPATNETEAEEPKRIVHLHQFRTPSGNIGCVLYEGGARCDIRKRDWGPGPRPASCPEEVDYGQGLQVGVGQAGFVCAGDTALEPGLASLAYGTASRVGGSECISRSDGVTCVNGAGHGFFVSVQSYQIF